MATKYFAMAFGVVYGLVGVLGLLFPGFTLHNDVPPAGLAVAGGYGMLFGLFPVNVLHNLVHLLVGAWGIAVSGAERASIAYARALAVIFGVLTLMGLFPVLNLSFGLVPLFGHDIWLHALTAAASAYFGFVRHPRVSSLNRS